MQYFRTGILLFLFYLYIHVTFGIPRRSAFTSQENVSLMGLYYFCIFNPSSPTAFLPKWPPKTAPSPPPRAAPKAAFATSPAPIFPRLSCNRNRMGTCFDWNYIRLFCSSQLFAVLDHLYTDRKPPVALRRRGLLRLSTSIFRYNYFYLE